MTRRAAPWVGCSVLQVLLGSLGCALDDRAVRTVSAFEDAGDASSRDGFGLDAIPGRNQMNGARDVLGSANANTNMSDAGPVPSCTAGESTCSSAIQALECSGDGLSSVTLACEFACIDDVCAGECVPDRSECVSTTRLRVCGDTGSWPEPTECDKACIDDACAGECVPGQTRCASSTLVETCDDRGQWGAAAPCQNACVGEACTGECSPGSARCSSTTQQQLCSELGQWQTPTSCENVCTGTSCGGECRPGTRRCLNDGVTQQTCGQTGQFGPSESCPFGCIGQSCAACTPGTSRCLNDGLTQQTCGASGQFVQSQTCDFGCSDSSCDECIPGDRRCDDNQPQRCNAAGQWQSDGDCAGGVCFGAGVCRLGDGRGCTNDAQCDSGQCTTLFPDDDGDGFGAGEPIRRCGPVTTGFSLNDIDCCDSDPNSFPGANPTATTDPNPCGNFDRDCSGRVENTFQESIDVVGGNFQRCENIPLAACEASVLNRGGSPFQAWPQDIPPCGETGDWIVCEVRSSASDRVCFGLTGGTGQVNTCR